MQRFFQRFFQRLPGLLLLLTIVACGIIGSPTAQMAVSQQMSSLYTANAPRSRDAWLWPFSQNSIWNTPIGNEAAYKPLDIPIVPHAMVDVNLLFKIPSDSPQRPLYNPGSWTNRCQGTATFENISIPIPDHLIVPDAINTSTVFYTPNNSSALLQADGKTIIQISPMARCEKGGPVYGWRYSPNLDLYGAGSGGSQFGSGLSAIGGTIRQGELVGNAPIRHVLKILLWEKILSFDPKSSTPGYRWPADRADEAAADMYQGSDPDLVMGSLLAIPPSFTESQLGLKTPIGKKLFHALQDYGAYQVDSTGMDAYGFAIDQKVQTELQEKYGYTLSPSRGDDNPFYDDFVKLFETLHVVTNNAPDRVGGGGKRRAPLAPPFS